MNGFGLKLIVVSVALAGLVFAEADLGELFAKKEKLSAEIKAVEKEYEPKMKPLQEQLQKMRDEMREKTKAQSDQESEIEKQIAEEFSKLMPSGKPSYGDFKWGCRAGSWLNVTANDQAGKQMVWVQVFHRPEMTPEQQKAYGNKECCGFPAKRFTDKWVWIQCGKVEMRFGLSDKSLESDATLDAIVASFDLEAISKL